MAYTALLSIIGQGSEDLKAAMNCITAKEDTESHDSTSHQGIIQHDESGCRKAPPVAVRLQVVQMLIEAAVLPGCSLQQLLQLPQRHAAILQRGRHSAVCCVVQ